MNMKVLLIASLSVAFAICANAQSISSLSPAEGPVGTNVTISGSGFAATGNVVRFQSAMTSAINEARITASSQDGTHLAFTVPAYVDPYCRYQTPPCASPSMPVYNGAYIVYVEVAGSMSNGLLFNVTDTPKPPPGVYSLSVQSSISSPDIHVSVDPPGDITTYPVAYTYTSPTTVTLNAYDHLPAGGGVRIVFVGWSEGFVGASRIATFTVNGVYSITANYEYQSDVPTLAPTPAPTAVVDCTGRFGDSNQDGAITIVDALVIAQAYVGITPTGRYVPECSDVDHNGVVNIIDALIVAQCYVGLRPCDF